MLDRLRKIVINDMTPEKEDTKKTYLLEQAGSRVKRLKAENCLEFTFSKNNIERF